jgi:hypothetical protein
MRTRAQVANPTACSEGGGAPQRRRFSLESCTAAVCWRGKSAGPYTHTPSWEYFDLHKNEPYTGWQGSSYRVEMQPEPIEAWDGDDNPTPGTPYWVSLEDITENDVLPNNFWEAVIDAIDAKCKVEDAERRIAAKARQAKLTPKSRKRH